MWPTDNPESWKEIHEFIEEHPNDNYWSKWKPMANQVISELEGRGLDKLFRVGQSMHTIIFSTLDHHRLAGEPRVTLDFDAEEQKVQIAYARNQGHLLFLDAASYRAPVAQETVPLFLPPFQSYSTSFGVCGAKPTSPQFQMASKTSNRRCMLLKWKSRDYNQHQFKWHSIVKAKTIKLKMMI